MALFHLFVKVLGPGDGEETDLFGPLVKLSLVNFSLTTQR